ncbi:MAG: Na(+)-translocating NADH-quinone reductase subunit C [Thermoguttaceae bacterium]|nr:Na(+)-translocating NADH-quinone reductase subunit C [Thermoguttaceae bacterium]
MEKDSIFKTFAVALGVCVVCAIIVSVAATVLKPLQEKNKLLDKQTNVLRAAGLVDMKASVSAAEVAELFKKISPVVVDLATGDIVKDAKPAQIEADESNTVAIPANDDVAGIKSRPKQVVVYVVKDASGKPETIVLPVYGRGLWSTMKGFFGIKGDLQTVKNLTFYDHGETPGLGGEISNPVWVHHWNDKKALDERGNPVITIIKGNVDPTSPQADSQVDGISGATLTCRGVNHTMQYWLGDSGFGKYIKNLKEGK